MSTTDGAVVKIRDLSMNLYHAVTGKPAYQLPYALARFRRPPVSDLRADLVCVLPPQRSPSWILHAICHEILERSPIAGLACPIDRPLPLASAYFFSHWRFLSTSLLRGDRLPGKTLVFFTHPSCPDGTIDANAEEMFVLRRADCVVSMSQMFRDALRDAGIPDERLCTATIGADPRFFQPHARSNGAVGVCAAFYERKHPERLLNVARELPHRHFVLLGRGWRTWSRFSELQSLPNFTYDERPYTDYPSFYNGIDVLLSTAVLEGGPVPLLEAMMCNCVPVASITGIAPELIRHGDNGFLYPTDAPAHVIAEMIELAFACTSDIRSTVQHLTWDRFARQIIDIAGLASCSTPGSPATGPERVQRSV